MSAAQMHDRCLKIGCLLSLIIPLGGYDLAIREYWYIEKMEQSPTPASQGKGQASTSTCRNAGGVTAVLPLASY